jgi:predicted ATP-grasp superfamily ATP-dependent carboligase
VNSALPCIAIIGRLGTPQLACLRSWRRQGVPCVFLHAAPAPLPRMVQALLGVRCVQLGPLRLDDPGFVARLAAVLEQERVQVLTCVSEPIGVALWNCQDRLPHGLRIAAVRPEAAGRLESKVEQDRLARAAGLEVLPSFTFAPGDAVDLPAARFPLVVRPDVALRVVPAFKVCVVHDNEALRQLVAGLAPHSCGVIAQPLVHGPNLLVHGYRSADGRFGGHVAFEVGVKHRGLTVTMRPVELASSIAFGCAQIERELGLSGVFHYEFIVDEQTGQARFLDLNPRLGGTTGKVLSAGYDEPMALLASQLPQGLPEARFLSPNLRPTGGKHQALRALWSVLRGTSTAADYPCPDRLRAVRELLAFIALGRDEIVRLDALRSSLGFALYKLLGRVAFRPR